VFKYIGLIIQLYDGENVIPHVLLIKDNYDFGFGLTSLKRAPNLPPE
jgi:hypothetical protein